MNLRDTLGIPVDMLPMGDADLDAVTALEASVQAFPWSRGNFADSLTAGHSVWVCRIGGELVGFAVLMLVLDEAHLLNFAVCRRFQGQGLGARLLLHSLKAAAGHGAVKLFLEVRPSNYKAIALYRDFGFRQIGLRRGYYPASEGREDALVFERKLCP